jgi:hypothetical protein
VWAEKRLWRSRRLWDEVEEDEKELEEVRQSSPPTEGGVDYNHINEALDLCAVQARPRLKSDMVLRLNPLG